MDTTPASCELVIHERVVAALFKRNAVVGVVYELVGGECIVVARFREHDPHCICLNN